MRIGLAFLASLLSAAPCRAAREPLRGPEVWLELMGGNVRKDGLRLDLEAIKAAGISGVQFFHIGDRGGPDQKGKRIWPGCEETQTPCMSAGWGDLVRFMGEECERLGLGLTVQNCPGWSQSGGPWVDLDHCQRDLQMARLDLKGGERIRLPEIPEKYRDADSDWRDICVLAFPTPAGDAPDPILRPARVEKDGETRIFRFAEPVTVRSLVLPPGVGMWNPPFRYDTPWLRFALDVRTPDGWREIAEAPLPTSNWRDYLLTYTIACEETTGDAFRFRVAHERPIRNYYEPTLSSAARQTDWESKSARTLRSLVREPHPRQSADAWLDRAAVVDLTGRTDWVAPEGRWTVLRLGHVNCKYVNSPAPKEATGWECDKLDPAGIETHFNGYVRRLAEGELKGRMRAMLVDSWECFTQTWTPKMERYFREANGYELRPWLPTLFGWVVGSPEATEKFLNDWRRTNGDLVTRNYYGRMAELAHAAGLEVYYEAAFREVIHGDYLEFWKYADAPMCEFWYPYAPRSVGSSGCYFNKVTLACASAAHIYGKRRVAAEAFTGNGIQWDEDFCNMQGVANRYFARGITHLVFQSYTHAPVPDAVPPGGCMGGFNGTPFTRLQTWWKLMPEFTGWLTRCEDFLEAGEPSEDVLWYLGDAMDHKLSEFYPFPEGFRYDYLNHDVLTNRLAVKDGLFATPEGVTWKVLWVPDTLFMRPETKAALDRLAAAGGKVVVGGKDALLKALAGTPKDVATEPALGDGPSDDFMWLHRKVDGKDRYFVAAGTNGYRGKVTFRAEGPVTVVDPVSCECRAWRNGDILEILPSRSVFVEFGNLRNDGVLAVVPDAGNSGSPATTRTSSPRSLEIRDWTLRFEKGWGAPETVTLETPVSWTEIPGFSREAQAYPGTVVYTATFDLPTSTSTFDLDLSNVASIAAVFVNGRKVRTLWCEPFSCDISQYVVKGKNELRIEVTNTWRNRIIYDLGQPEKDRKTWIIYQKAYNPGPKDPYVPAGILGPVLLRQAASEIGSREDLK